MVDRLRPSIFADTSKISEIEQLVELGIISGITTNPLIVAKEAQGADPSKYYEEIAKTFKNKPVSVQLLDADVPTLVAQAIDYSQIAPNIVIKVPMFGDGKGLSVIARLAQDQPNIKVNVTALMTKEQALLAWIAGSQGELKGPAYLSLFYRRIMDGEGDPIREINETRKFLDQADTSTRIIAGSIRKPEDVFQASVAGAHIVTVTPPIIRQMIKHPQSGKFIDQCQQQWNEIMSAKS